MAALSLWQRLGVMINGQLPGSSDSAAAGQTVLREAAGRNIDNDEDQWRRLTGQTNRDLSPMTQTRMQELALYLWESNPLANWIIELGVAYLLGEGVTVSTDDKKAQEWIDAFWNDPINNLDINLEQMVRELALYGEQCWPAFVNEINGHVRLGYLDPGLIETVVLDPDNAKQPIGIVTVKDKHGKARRYRVIVNGPESVFSARTQEIRESFDDGEAFYFRINGLANGRRGRSDLLAGADWLDGYDTFLFGELERNSFLRAFLWDVTLTGANQDEVEERAKKIAVPKSGGIRIHNEAEIWQAVAPEIHAGEATDTARLMRNQVLGGRGLPEHWFGGGGDVNRATAAEMAEPTFKLLSMRQRFVQYMIEAVCIYQVRQRSLVKGGNFDLEDNPDMRPQVSFPEMTARDTTKYAAALAQAVAAGVNAIDRGLLSEETALQVIGALAGRLGVEIDPGEELKKARKEADNRAEDDVFADPPDLDGDDDEDGAGVKNGE